MIFETAPLLTARQSGEVRIRALERLRASRSILRSNPEKQRIFAPKTAFLRQKGALFGLKNGKK